MPPRRPQAGDSSYTPPVIKSSPSAGVAAKSWSPAASEVRRTTTTTSRPVSSAASTAGSTVYVIKKGDVLSRVAYKSGISTKELAEFNNLATPDAIRVGQKILIPAHGKSINGSSAAKTVSAPKAPSASKPKMVTAAAGGGSPKYTVQKGDSLSVIAWRYGTTVSSIRAANQLSSDRIQVGDELVVAGATKTPGGKTVVEASKPKAEVKAPAIPTVGTVSAPKRPAVTGYEKVGEISVPRPSSTKTDPLINSPLGVKPVAVPAVVTPTPRVVEAPATVTTAEAKELEQAFEYVVQAGETIDDIARAFIVSVEDVRKLNKLGESDKVAPGQTLKIPPSIF
jgi:LysM repeat protein